MFISFEGLDGCGKTTQAAMLSDALELEGRTVVRVREPVSTVLEMTEIQTRLIAEGGDKSLGILRPGWRRGEQPSEQDQSEDYRGTSCHFAETWCC